MIGIPLRRIVSALLSGFIIRQEFQLEKSVRCLNPPARKQAHPRAAVAIKAQVTARLLTHCEAMRAETDCHFPPQLQ
jgi:hypothetical protein